MADRYEPDTEPGPSTVLDEIQNGNQNEEPTAQPFAQILKDIIVVDINESCQLKDGRFRKIQYDLVQSKYIGLTVLGRMGEKPLAICLTCKTCRGNDIGTTIYVLHAEYNHLVFLGQQLNNRSLVFFTVEGVQTALSLHPYKIRLNDRNVVDLQAYDIYLAYVRNMRLRLEGIEQIYDKLKYITPDLNQLVSRWLNKKKDYEGLNFSYTQEELQSLESKPYNEVANNLIIKQCALVRQLGVAMRSFSTEQLKEPAKAIYSLSKRASDEIKENYDRQGSRDWTSLVNALGQCPALENDENL